MMRKRHAAAFFPDVFFRIIAGYLSPRHSQPQTYFFLFDQARASGLTLRGNGCLEIRITVFLYSRW